MLSTFKKVNPFCKSKHKGAAPVSLEPKKESKPKKAKG